MKRFVKRFENRIQGILTGVDRVLFRGTLRSISYMKGLEIFLYSRKIAHKEFVRFAKEASEQIRTHLEGLACRHGRPVQYLRSSSVSKEELAREIQQRDKVPHGLICVFSSVEPCHTFRVRGNREKRILELVPMQGKCLHWYVYWMDREFGLLHVRLQSWLPFDMQICINGREWLARQMDRAGIDYQRRENCFVRIGNLKKAQQKMQQLEQRNWQRWLTRWAERINVWLQSEHGQHVFGYYWSVRQSEVATDVMFRDERALAQVYPALVGHAMGQFHSDDVLRFLGQRRPEAYQGDVTSHLGKRWEGVRVKHRVGKNSIKMYDKQGSVLRIETTINDPRRLRVRRQVTRQGEPCLAWLPLRKGIADFRRRMQICRAANERYLEALAPVAVPTRCDKILDPVSAAVEVERRRYRALHPLAPTEAARLAPLQDAQFLLHGFRARDLKPFWEEINEEQAEEVSPARLSGRITRWLAMLRAHRLIYRVPRTLHYRLTKRGAMVISTSSKLRKLDAASLAA